MHTNDHRREHNLGTDLCNGAGEIASAALQVIPVHHQAVETTHATTAAASEVVTQVTEAAPIADASSGILEMAGDAISSVGEVLSGLTP